MTLALDSKQLRTFGFLAALVVFALGIALLLRRDAGDGAEFAGAASSPEGAAASPGTSRAKDEVSTDTSSARAALDANESNANGATDAPPEPGIGLVPVVGVFRRRVAPVELWWWQPKDLDNWQELRQVRRWLEAGELDTRLAEVAQALVADELGRFHAPEPEATGCVVARGESLWGWTVVSRTSPDPTYIELERDFTLRAQVLDASGAPAAGARVALRQRWGRDDEPDMSLNLGRALTGGDGIALFPHFRALMEDSWEFDSRYVLELAEPFLEPLQREFDPTRPPLEPLELQLPPAGRVVLDLANEPKGGQFSLRLGRATSQDPSGDTLSDDDFLRPADGRTVLFPYVGLGLFVTPTSHVQGLARVHDESAALGPTRAGEERHLRVDVRANASIGPRLHGTLVGSAIRPSGKTRADLSIDAHEPDGTEWSQNLRVSVLPDGQFVVPLARECEGQLHLIVNVLGPRDETVGRSNARTMGREGAAELEIGEILVEAMPLSVSGRVVDEQGRGVVGAEVAGWGKISAASGHWNDGWEAWGDLRVRSGRSGAFEMHFDRRWKAVGLSAWSADGVSEFTVVEVGTTDVVLTLGLDGSIAGSVPLDCGLPREFLYISVREEGSRKVPAGASPYRRGEVDFEGQFLVRGLAAGSYAVSVRLSGADLVLAEVANVLVEDGQLTRDPRLAPLEVGQWSELRIVDAELAPVIDARAHVLGRSSKRWNDRSARGGKILYEHSMSPLWLTSDRHVPMLFDPASRATSVQLETAPWTQVRIPDELAPALDGLDVQLHVLGRQLPPGVARAEHDKVALASKLSPKFRLRHLSSYSTELWLMGRIAVSLPHQLSGPLPGASPDSPQVFELRWKPEDFAAAIEQAR